MGMEKSKQNRPPIICEDIRTTTSQVRFNNNLPLTEYDKLFENVEPLPCLSRNDLDLLFDYLFVNSLYNMNLKVEWDRASAMGESELFLSSLCRVVGRRGLPLYIVRTRENGTKLLTDLKNGFVSLVFDMNI